MAARQGLTCLLEKLARRALVGNVYPESPQCREQVKSLLASGPACVYAGFDATADSLHVGNLATIMSLVHFHSRGHRVICLVGDATTRLGDPSGHAADRAKLPPDTIAANCDAIEETLAAVFRNYRQHFAQRPAASGQQLEPPLILRNSQWYKGREAVDFVGEVFREVRVGSLLHKKSVAERLASSAGMNMSEFSYQIFQAYDWLQLRNLYDCRLQLGGSDQAGNIYTGHDLIKKLTGARDSIGLLAPLITDARGKKLGKSSSASASPIWLRPHRTSPFHLYQFFHRTPDHSVEKFLNVFSLYDEQEIATLVAERLKQPDDIWHCQRKLAEHVCLLIHGSNGLESAQRETRAIYQRNPMD